MPVFISAIDSTIFFEEKTYYLYFKEHEIKYTPNSRQNKQDDLALKMRPEDDEESSYKIINELVSALCFSWDEPFELGPCMINKIPDDFQWEKMHCSTAEQRRFVPYEHKKDFIRIHPLENNEQIQLAHLYRQAIVANNIYTKILFFWHCLCYPNPNENEAISLMDTFVENEAESVQNDIEEILRSQLFRKEKNKDSTLGQYFTQYIRHSIAHITRNEKYKSKNLNLASIKEQQHLSRVKNILQHFARVRMINHFKINAVDDSNYLGYFDPARD